MVVHDAVGMDKPVEALDTVREHRQKSRPIFIVINNILPAITASGDVIQRSCVFDAKGASHEVAWCSNVRVDQYQRNLCTEQDLTPLFPQCLQNYFLKKIIIVQTIPQL